MKDKELQGKINSAFSHAVPDVFDNILSMIDGNAAKKIDTGEAVFTSKKTDGGDAALRQAQPIGEDEIGNTVRKAQSKEDANDEHIMLKSAVITDDVSKPKRSPWILRSALIALAAAAAIFIPVGISSYNAINAIASVVSLDVNPSIEINVNKNRRVVSVVPMNDDAVDIIGDMNFKGTDLNVAINALLGAMISKGYLSEIANSILISVDNSDPAEAEALQKLLMEEIDKILKSDTFNGAIIGQTIKDDEKLRTLAEQYGITMSKAQLIDEIIAKNPKLKFEDLVKLPINDLNLLKGADSANVVSIGAASDSGYVGADAAMLTALENTGLNKENVNDLEVSMDYENGALVYEVDFNADGTKFEYEIDALTGKIVKGEQEGVKYREAAEAARKAAEEEKARKAAEEEAKKAAESQAAANNNNAAQAGNNNQGGNQQQAQSAATSLISYDRARQAALSHAGVGNIYDYEIELDYDGTPHYEIEFKSGNTEYSYEINAYDGSVMWYETDYDDDDYVAPRAAQSQGNSGQSQGPVQTPAPAQTQAAAPADIGAGKAKSIALSHAGVSAGSARDMEVDIDHDDGRIIYEVNFKAGGYEYSYEIDGRTGAILDFEKDEDD